jgi:putative DNA primase/helicase
VAKPSHEIGSPRLIVARLSDVVTQPIEWFWQRRLARGKVHVLGGDYGDGKSTLMAWLAATLSTGGAWPDGDNAPLAKVLFLLLEDGIDDTLKPRLAIHNADQDRIFALEAVAEEEGTRRVFRLDRHLDLLRAYVREQGIDLIIIDPVSAFMTGTNRDTEGAVRDVLTPLVDLANELGVAIMALMHTGKPGMGTGGRTPTQRLLGSTAFPAVARVVWMLASTPDDPGRKVLAVTKSNLDLKPDPLEWSRALDQPIVWHGVSDHDITQLFDAIKPMPRQEAKAWLVEALTGGNVPQRIVETRARELGISPATLKRAREELGVISKKQTGVVNGAWL